MTERAPESNVEIVFADWLDAIRRGDIERMRARLAPDVVHQGVRPEYVCRNRDEVMAQAGWRAGRAPAVEAIELVAAGDHVVMSVRAPDIGAPADPEAAPPGQASIVFTLRDGLIVRMQDFPTRAGALEAAGSAFGWE